MMDIQALWQLLQPYLAGQLRHALTVLAGILIAKGALASDQQGAFVSIGSGFILWAIGALWSWWQKNGQAETRKALARAETQLGAMNLRASPAQPHPGAAVQQMMGAKK